MEHQSKIQTWLYDNLPVGIAMLDRELIYRYANSAYAATQGYATPQLVDHPLSLSQPEWCERITAMARRAQAVRRVVDAYNVTLTYPRQPTMQRTWDISVLPVYQENELDGFVLYLIDVTSRHQAEQLIISESRLRSIFDAAADAIFIADEHGAILQVNPAVSRIFGYTTDELLGKPLTTIMPSPYQEEHDRFMERYVNTSIPRIIGTIREVVGRRKDGRVFPGELSVAESRESVQHRFFVGIIRDISERKQLEAALEDARARLETILNTVPLPLFVMLPDRTINIANEAAREFYGEELRKNNVLKMTRLYPDTRKPWPVDDWPLMRALTEGKAIHDVEQIIVFPDGREVPVLAHAAPVIAEGHTIAAVGVLQDLTQLKAADRAKDAFLALITHELKSPLINIISWADLAQDDPSLCGEAVQVILRSANAQRRIIDDLLDISRVLYGKLVLEKEQVDAWEIVLNAVEAQRATIAQRQLKLELHPPSTPLPVLADPVRLGQVFNNLLTNAMKFTQAGGVITLEGCREDDMARINVIDTGLGITSAQLPFIFERFQQLGRERLSGGLGLGLAVVKGLVELHGGRVSAFSPGEGKGSTFSVWLPLYEDESESM